MHGVEVMALEPGTGWIQVEGIDGWTTTARGILLTVTVADCIPVYLVRAGAGGGACCTPGWRGTAAGMLQRGVTRLAGATGAPPRDMVMHCGVGICGAAMKSALRSWRDVALTAEGPGPFHLDLRDHLGDEARRLGVGVITASGWCSAHDRERSTAIAVPVARTVGWSAYVGMPRAH